MKKLFLLLYFSTLTGLIYAQHKYIPFPDSNAIWVETSIYDNVKHDGYGQCRIQKDTLIQGAIYKKIHYVDSNYDAGPKKREVWFGIRDDTVNRKVYIIDFISDDGKEKLLYDFTLNVGDTFPANSYSSGGRYGRSIITRIDSILIEGNNHHVFYATSLINGALKPYIEGIGSVAGNIYPAFDFEGKGSLLICMMKEKPLRPYFTTIGNGAHCKLHKIKDYTSVNENKRTTNEIKIIPHPVSENSIITLSNTNEHIEKITIHGINGSPIVLQKMNESGEINIARFIKTPGLYIITVVTENGFYSKRIVKM